MFVFVGSFLLVAHQSFEGIVFECRMSHVGWMNLQHSVLVLEFSISNMVARVLKPARQHPVTFFS